MSHLSFQEWEEEDRAGNQRPVLNASDMHSQVIHCSVGFPSQYREPRRVCLQHCQTAPGNMNMLLQKPNKIQSSQKSFLG